MRKNFRDHQGDPLKRSFSVLFDLDTALPYSSGFFYHLYDCFMRSTVAETT